MTEPMTDAELEVWREVLAGREYSSRTLDVYATAMSHLIARLDAERSRADAAEAARDAALARAIPEPVLMETIEQVEALPPGLYLYGNPRARILVNITERHPGGVWTFLSTDDVRNDRLMVNVWIAGPLPDLPIPTNGDANV
ncbi:MAG: hypothetical protein IPK85_01970 [Gemmatimonadetes bacterium]|nr:hypothetical protein [Gemmatimonadota bacterium]